ncbi:hypothetical protein C4D60_Mb00t18760 [Musa balbisiana]|uniref:Uncharacterized protein n=1 Tax=Musa balbisiana TaxID=52838 RepID=A0A4S8I296_MUSBA|nr:hypothetical protein C4D60_Mb00t18760 [Musa balbisiana]
MLWLNIIDGRGEIYASLNSVIEYLLPQTCVYEPSSKRGRGQRELILGTDRPAKHRSHRIASQSKSYWSKSIFCGSGSDTFGEGGRWKYYCGQPKRRIHLIHYRPRHPYTGERLWLSFDAQAYRQMSLLLRRPPVVKLARDVFDLHYGLWKRADKSNMTALPIVETQSGGRSAYITTRIYSMLESDLLFNVGIPFIEINGKRSTITRGCFKPNPIKEISQWKERCYIGYRSEWKYLDPLEIGQVKKFSAVT